MSKLIILSSSFPIFNSETFLEKEYKYLNEKFRDINFIVVSVNKRTGNIYDGIDHSNVIQINNQKRNTLLAIFSSLFSLKFLREVFYVLAKIKPRYFISSLKVAVISFHNAKRIMKVIEDGVLTSSTEKIIIYSYWCDDSAIAASLLKKNPKVCKVVTRTHGWDLNFSVHSPPYLPFRTLIQKSCDNIFPISNKGKSVIASEWKVPIDNVIVSKLGVERQQIISEKDSSTFTIVSCSLVIPLKRVQLIAESIMKIEMPIKWVHFGSGGELESIADFVNQNKKVNHEVVFMGEVENHEVLNFYKNNEVDLFINASTTEGIPFSIMEVMSFGIPALATNVGGNSEIVNDENGFLLPENPTAIEIAFQINRFMSMEKSEFELYSKKAYKTWESEYNAEKNFTEFVESISI